MTTRAISVATTSFGEIQGKSNVQRIFSLLPSLAGSSILYPSNILNGNKCDLKEVNGAAAQVR